MGDLTKDYSSSEVCCKCPICQSDPNPIVPTVEVMLIAQGVRTDLGKPVVVTCGVRCAAHNQQEGGAPDSRHLPGFRDAIDLECLDSNDRFRMIKSLISHGAKFIEVCLNHIHFDQRPTAPKLIIGVDH